MDNTDKPRIHIIIADKKYPFPAMSAATEEMLRKAAAIINERVEVYKRQYPGKDLQDALAIASLQFVHQWRKERAADISGKMTKEVEMIDAQLGEYLNKII